MRNQFLQYCGTPDNVFTIAIHFSRERVVRNISRHNFEGIKKKLLTANDKDTVSSTDHKNQGNGSDSDCNDSHDSDGESVWPDTKDVNEFPELPGASRTQRIC